MLRVRHQLVIFPSDNGDVALLTFGNFDRFQDYIVVRADVQITNTVQLKRVRTP